MDYMERDCKAQLEGLIKITDDFETKNQNLIEDNHSTRNHVEQIISIIKGLNSDVATREKKLQHVKEQLTILSQEWVELDKLDKEKKDDLESL